MDKTKSGGITALRGFDYQATVILDLLFEHFDTHGASARVRPEGEDDLDLKWENTDGSSCQKFIQIKKPREDSNNYTPTNEAWTLSEIAKQLIPGALRNLANNPYQQIWLLGDNIETEIEALVAAGNSSPQDAPNSYWLLIHLLSRIKPLKRSSISKKDKTKLMRWRPKATLFSKPDTAEAELVKTYTQRLSEVSSDTDIINIYLDEVQKHHSTLPDIIARIRVRPNYGSEEDITHKIYERLKQEYGLSVSIVENTLFRNLRGFINDISKQPGRDFNKEEFELELRSVWPTMMPNRELPQLDKEHISRNDLSALFTTNWSGNALEIVGPSGSGKTMLAAEAGKQSVQTAPNREVIYLTIRPDTELRDALAGVAFHLRRIGINQPFSIAVNNSDATESVLEKLAHAMSASPREVLLLADLTQGVCSESFARDLATFIRNLSSEGCRLAVLGQERAFRKLNSLDRKQLDIKTVDVRGFSFDEFSKLVSLNHKNPDSALLQEVFRKVTAGRSVGLYAKLARSLADASSLEKMMELSSMSAEDILEHAERQRFNCISDNARPAAEKLTCFALPFSRSEAEAVFMHDNVGTAIHELWDLGLLRGTGGDDYEMHETIRAGLEKTIALGTRQEAHKALASHYANLADVTAEVFHLEQAGSKTEAERTAKEAFLQGKNWRKLFKLVTTRQLITPQEVIDTVTLSERIEGVYFLADILARLDESIDANTIFSTIQARPQRFFNDYQWSSALIEACLAADSDYLHKLVHFCMGTTHVSELRSNGLSTISFKAKQLGCPLGQETLDFFDRSTQDEKRLLTPFLLGFHTREAFTRALNFIENDKINSHGNRQSQPSGYNLTLCDQEGVIAFLASLPDIPATEMFLNHSPLLGELTTIVWQNRHLLKTNSIEILKAKEHEPTILKAAIRVLALLAEPSLSSLCKPLAQDKDNPVRTIAAFAPALTPAAVDPSQYETIMFDLQQDFEDRMTAFGILASVGVDLGALYNRLHEIETDPTQLKIWGFFFLQFTIKTPFAEAIPLLEKELWATQTDNHSIFVGALMGLGQLPTPAATSLLIKSLAHPDRSVRNTAIVALGKKRTKAALEPLKRYFRAEKDRNVKATLMTAIVASGAESVSDLESAHCQDDTLSLWKCVLAARTRDKSFAPKLVELANNTSNHWQIRRAAINAAGFLPYDVALVKMLPIMRERSPLSLDNQQALNTHSFLSWLLLNESINLRPRFARSKEDFIKLIEGLLKDSSNNVIDTLGMAPESETANWLYNRLKSHGWPEEQSAPDKVISELHIPLLQSAVLRSLRRSKHGDMIKSVFSDTDQYWIAMKCILEIYRLELAHIDTDEIKGIISQSSIADASRLELIVSRLPKVSPSPKAVTRHTHQSTLSEPTKRLTGYKEILVAIENNSLSGLQSPIELKPLTPDQFHHLVQVLNPINDIHDGYTERYVPGIVFEQNGHSVAQRQLTSTGTSDPVSAWIRPALVAANSFDITIQWHEELLASQFQKTYIQRLVACLSRGDKAEIFYRELYQHSHLLLPYICTYEARQQIEQFIDDRIIPLLTTYASSGTDEIFEGICGLAGIVNSPAIDKVLSTLFERWTSHFKGRQRDSYKEASHHWWRTFHALTEHPRFEYIQDWYNHLSPVIQAPLPWYHKQDVTRVLERDKRFYIELESQLFASEDWEHFYEDEIERLQEAAERQFKQVEHR